MGSLYSFKKEENYLVMTISGDYSYADFIKYPKIIRNRMSNRKKI